MVVKTTNAYDEHIIQGTGRRAQDCGATVGWRARCDREFKAQYIFLAVKQLFSVVSASLGRMVQNLASDHTSGYRCDKCERQSRYKLE